MKNSFERIHLIISGRVQGVGFRHFTQMEAKKIGITGWVKNLPNGNVETLAEGTKEHIERFFSWCHEGPPSSHVEKVQVLSRESTHEKNFQDFQIIKL